MMVDKSLGGESETVAFVLGGGGLRGAAEYEKLLGVGGSGQRGMLAQTTSHVYVILMIIVGHAVYFLGRRKSGRGNS